MNIVVCLKQTLDPEIPSKEFKIDEATKKPVQGKAKFVMDSYAENALEMAIKLKEADGSKVTVITVGDASSDDVLKRGLAFTADEAYRVWDDSFADLDAKAVATVLGAAIEKIGGADLILAGRQAADLERGSVGPMIGEVLKRDTITFVAKAEPNGDVVKFTREIDGGVEIVESKLPVAITATSHETNIPRLPKVKDTMKAARKKIDVIGAADLGLSADALKSGIITNDVFVPVVESKCEIIQGDDGSAKAGALANKLRELKLI